MSGGWLAEAARRSAAPRWFSIAAHRPFLDDLAAGLHSALAADGPEALAEAVVLVPTRRAAQALAASFVDVRRGQALLLPQIRALGDLDEGEPPFEPGALSLDLPAAISISRRRFELARLVVEHAHMFARPIDTTAALDLGDALAGLLDSLQIEEIGDLGRIDTLVEGDLARHWTASAEFLKVATIAWPRRLAELGLVDVTQRRTLLLRALAEQWRRSPPERPLIAAGSTGTAPATAELLAVIAQAPNGCVVLPGLDLELADAAWNQVAEDHPQGAMHRLLERAGVARADVHPWPAEESARERIRGRSRRRVINEALRPAEATGDWLGVIEGLKREGEATAVDVVADGLDGLSLAVAATEERAAAMVALLLRETLEQPGRTAALVTPDAALARRVSARLGRWGVRVDSSAGAPLSEFPAGTMMSLLAREVAEPLQPAALLALIKHPRTRLGLDEPSLRRAAAQLERYGLRGPRPHDWDALRARLEAARLRGRATQEAPDLAKRLQAVLDAAAAPFRTDVASAADAGRALAEAMETLAGDDQGGAGKLWSGADGEAAAELLASLMEEGEALPLCTPSGFAQLVQTLADSKVVRSGGATHPRLKILGAIEARLIRADRLVVAGLEEGVWPRAAAIDPFLSRPMRVKLGLPPPERRTGLAAHDFAQAACAREVVLIHTERRGGQPTVMSRWLWRLRTLARGAGTDLPRRDDVAGWARGLDATLGDPPASLRSQPRPAPTPPVDVRPRELPVTGVEQWLRDPYALYARRILRLRLMERPDAPVEARARGTAIHAAFEQFARDHPDKLPDEAEAVFEELLRRSLVGAGMPLASMAREQALGRRVASWSVAFERRRRPGARLLIEQTGDVKLMVEGETFTLTAKPDRVELRSAGADVLDFKTGQPPKDKVVKSGLAPQLTLTAAILSRGGFSDIGPVNPGALVYVRVSGGRIPGEEIIAATALESLAETEAAVEGLMRRVRLFRNPAQGYLAKAAPKFMSAPGDYDHLSRQWEWHVMGEDDDGSAE